MFIGALLQSHWPHTLLWTPTNIIN